MPCDTVQESKVEFLEKSTDVKLLAEALRKLGYRVTENEEGLAFSKGYGWNGTYESKTGKLTLPEQQDGNEIKRAYSEEVVNHQARKFGWQISWSTNPQGTKTAKVVKRS